VATVRCPDCGHDVPVPPDARPGDLIGCPTCAGLSLRLRAEGEWWTASIAHRVSCPDCDRTIVLPESARTGDVIECCGRVYRLTFEFGAFAAERISEVEA
jgi:endogenous inhibitor of DNA gyrase (YacG/DUF329 family)